MILDDAQRRRDHALVIRRGDGRLLQIDIQPVEAILLHQTDDLVSQRLLLSAAQLDVGVGTAQRQQH